MKNCNYLKTMLAVFAMIFMSLPGVPGMHAQSNSGEAVIKSIKGQVLDDEGEPLPGAMVRIKGMKGLEATTTTDVNGAFGFK